MEIKLFLVIGILAIILVICIAWLFYYIGLVKGFNRCKQIDDEILESKGIMVD